MEIVSRQAERAGHVRTGGVGYQGEMAVRNAAASALNAWMCGGGAPHWQA